MIDLAEAAGYGDSAGRRATTRIAHDAALLLDRLVRQGRAFGIHVLLEEIGKPYDLQKIDGIGKDLAEKISTLLDTGEIPMLEELRQQGLENLSQLFKAQAQEPVSLITVLARHFFRRSRDRDPDLAAQLPTPLASLVSTLPTPGVPPVIWKPVAFTVPPTSSLAVGLATPTPMSRSRRSWLSTSSLSVINVPSVISTSRR